MGTVWIKEFTGGLDSRRMAETTPGGVLIRAADGHITRGGEFEKRPAFVPTYDLPPGHTTGLAQTRSGLVVFGHDTAPADLPSGVSYQQLENPDDSTLEIDRILSWDLNAGLVYAVAQYTDGSIHHFYNGVVVTDWFDGRARGSFTVAGDAGDSLTNLTVNGVAIINSVVNWTTDNATTAAAIAAEINSAPSTPEYIATSVGEQVNIIASAQSAAANGLLVVATVTDLVLSPATGLTLEGGGGEFVAAVKASAKFIIVPGSDSGAKTITGITIAGVQIMNATITYTTTAKAMAIAVASNINGFATTPEYTATAAGDIVTIWAAASEGATANSRRVLVATTGGLSAKAANANQAGQIRLDGGVTEVNVYLPGTYVRTIDSKMYSVADSNLHFSGIKQPTKWTTATTGAGFINLAAVSSGAEKLHAVATYQEFVAIFAADVTLIYYVDPDPNLNRKSQVLNNTGTSCPGSVTQFGDNDIFYLHESGLRSLQAREQSDAASTTDIGVPVDSLIVAKLRGLSETERGDVIGLINPDDGRFWLSMLDEIFVFSFYTNAKVSAWSTYNPGYEDVNGVIVPIRIEEAVVFSRRVYVREGDTIYAFGGVGNELTYDITEAEAWVPYFDANKPTAKKDWQGADAAIQGTWVVRAAMDPTDVTASDKIATIDKTTYDQNRIPAVGSHTHLQLRFKSSGTGPAKLSAAVLHYFGDEEQ